MDEVKVCNATVRYFLKLSIKNCGGRSWFSEKENTSPPFLSSEKRSQCSLYTPSILSFMSLHSSNAKSVFSGSKSNIVRAQPSKGIRKDAPENEPPCDNFSVISSAMARERSYALPLGAFFTSAASFAVISAISAGVTNASVAAITVISVVSGSLSPVTPSYGRIFSTVSPKKSTRTGFSLLTGNISKTSPRIAKQPLLSAAYSRA